MRALKYFILLSTALLVGFTTASYYWLGLDDNGTNEIDASLETAQPTEEIGFKQVAQLIEGFVVNQYQRRQTQKNKEKYAALYRDLPGGMYATRDVHRKTHGCFKADLKISDQLAENLHAANASFSFDKNELGVFQPGANYDAIVRFSNGHPQNRYDRQPDARGFAVKILAQGRLESQTSIQNQNAELLNDSTLLDILSINFPTFFVNEENTAMKYYEINENFLPGALDFTGSTLGKVHEGLSVFTSGVSAMEAQLALAVNGSVIKSPLFQEYFSMVPSRLGSPNSGRAVKYSWSPIACAGDEKEFAEEKLSEWPYWAKDHDYAQPLDPTKKNYTPPYLPFTDYPQNYLRKKLSTRLRQKDFCFALNVQPFIDQQSTNIEDSTDIWLRSEDERTWWLNKVVPSYLSPVAFAMGFKHSDYVKKIKAKKISSPIVAATLRIHRLNDSDVAANTKVCEDLSFNPWNGDIFHHKPLGVISRLKRRVYNASRRTRHMLNGIQDHERAL